jgi:hypothetical protein
LDGWVQQMQNALSELRKEPASPAAKEDQDASQRSALPAPEHAPAQHEAKTKAAAAAEGKRAQETFHELTVADQEIVTEVSSAQGSFASMEPKEESMNARRSRR